MKILIAEDRKVIREIIIALLEDISAEVIEAKDGIDALCELSKQNDIDLLITDLGMDRCSGYQLIDKIRKSGSNLKIITISTENPLLQLAKDYGANDVLCKDKLFDELIIKVKKVLHC